MHYLLTAAVLVAILVAHLRNIRFIRGAAHQEALDLARRERVLEWNELVVQNMVAAKAARECGLDDRADASLDIALFHGRALLAEIYTNPVLDRRNHPREDSKLT